MGTATITAGDVMSPATGCLAQIDSVGRAAAVMRELGVESVPVCDPEGRLTGVVTRHDVVRCLAVGWDPYSTALRELIDPETLSVSVDDPVESALITMAVHRVRRLPVVEAGNLVGIVADSDIARSLPDDALGRLLAPRTPGCA